MKGSKRNEGVRCRFFDAVIGASLIDCRSPDRCSLKPQGTDDNLSVPVGV